MARSHSLWEDKRPPTGARKRSADTLAPRTLTRFPGHPLPPGEGRGEGSASESDSLRRHARPQNPSPALAGTLSQWARLCTHLLLPPGGRRGEGGSLKTETCRRAPRQLAIVSDGCSSR
jgi:hypothetical protein